MTDLTEGVSRASLEIQSIGFSLNLRTCNLCKRAVYHNKSYKLWNLSIIRPHFLCFSKPSLKKTSKRMGMWTNKCVTFERQKLWLTIRSNSTWPLSFSLWEEKEDNQDWRNGEKLLVISNMSNNDSCLIPSISKGLLMNCHKLGVSNLIQDN